MLDKDQAQRSETLWSGSSGTELRLGVAPLRRGPGLNLELVF